MVLFFILLKVFLLFNIFIYLLFGCAGSSLLCAGFSLVAANHSCCDVWTSHCSFFRCGPKAWISGVVVHRLSCSAAWQNLPRPGIELMLPALVDRFLSSVLPRKSYWIMVLESKIWALGVLIILPVCFYLWALSADRIRKWMYLY